MSKRARRGHSHMHTYTHNPTSPSSQELPTSSPTPHSPTHHQPRPPHSPAPQVPPHHSTPPRPFKPHLPKPCLCPAPLHHGPAPFMAPPPQAPPPSTALLLSPVSSTPSSHELLSIHRARSKWVTRRPGTLRPSLACLLVLFPFRSCSSSRNWTPYPVTPTHLQL